MPEPVLAVEELHVAFGGVHALAGATFRMRAGTITGLIGPNGAGKTTLFDVVSGFTRPDRGRVLFEGRRVDGLPPHTIARSGIGRTFQLIRLMPRMDALENLLIAKGAPAGETLAGALTGGWQGDERAAETRCRDLLGEVDLGERTGVAAGSLSYGQQKLVELARVLSMESRLILLDEPMAGVNPAMRQRLLATIHRLHREGRAFLIVEHDLEMIMAHCDEVIVLDQGRTLAQGPPREVAANPEVIRAYMGARRTTGPLAPPKPDVRGGDADAR